MFDIEEAKYIFKKPLKDYKNETKPLKPYLKQITTYISKTRNIPMEEAKLITKEVIQEHGFKIPEVTFRQQQRNGDRKKETTKLTDYIADAIEHNEVMVPSFTTYVHPSVKKSLHADFINVNVGKRKVDKHLAFKYKQEGDDEKFLHYNTLQKVRKIFNNSLSGAYASKSTILFNPSAHYTLTSMTRSLASIGNAVSESVIAGNKHFRNPDIAMSYLVAIVSNYNKKHVDYAIHKYGLHIPTIKDVMDMVLYNTRNYWFDKTKEKEIENFISSCDDSDRAAMLYVNDLFHVKKHNESFTKTMLSNISKKVSEKFDDPLKIINSVPEGVMNLVHHICMDDIKGMSINYKELVDTELINILAGTAYNVTNELLKYKYFFKAFFRTNILPPSIAYIKDMLRDAIVLSDTDSTCGSYDSWVNWYFGADKYTAEAVALSATVMTINTQVMDHCIKIFSTNMNIDHNLTELMKMKNEFYWPVFVATNVSKHYYASVVIQEGNVYEKPDLELKGVHLIASASEQSVVEIAHNMKKEILGKLSNGENLDVGKYIKIVADNERHLLQRLKEGDINIFKRDKIKERSAYKLDDPLKTPYFHHMLWKEIFENKYGNPGEPTYAVVKIPTTLKSKRLIKEFIEEIDDRDIAEKLDKFLKKTKKDQLGTFRIPLAIAAGKGIPKEVIKSINSKRMIMDSLNLFYIVLETIGVYRKEGLLFMEMGY